MSRLWGVVIILLGVLFVVGARPLSRSLADYNQAMAAKIGRIARLPLLGLASSDSYWAFVCRVIGGFLLLVGVLVVLGVLVFQ